LKIEEHLYLLGFGAIGLWLSCGDWGWVKLV